MALTSIGERTIQKLRHGSALWKGWRAMGSNDRILASFPRSGSTWLRFVVAHALEPQRQLGYPEVDRIMLSWVEDDLRQAWPYAQPRLIKTHRRWNPGLPQALHVVRDPRPTLWSYFFFQRDNKHIGFGGDFDEFVAHPTYGIEAWIAHTRSWEGRASSVRYEDLIGRADVVAATLGVLGFSLNEEAIRIAAEKSGKDRVNELVWAHDNPRRNEFVTSAQSVERPSWKKEMPEASRSRIRQRVVESGYGRFLDESPGASPNAA